MKNINTIVTLAALLTSFLVFDARYAHSDQEDLREQQAVQSMQDFRTDYLMDKLNELEQKEVHEGISNWEKARKKQVQRELEKILK